MAHRARDTSLPPPRRRPRAALILGAAAALASLAPARGDGSVCAANSYASGGACAPCAAGSFSLAGATSAAQCRPTSFAGPTDTVFSFYGTAAEVAADYPVSGAAASNTYVADAYGGASSALSLTGAAYATTTTTRPALPSGNSARTSAAWIKMSKAWIETLRKA